ncbi:MAG: hypothetical protein GQ550_08845 [Gammaproteobacteria bacterium]|nr:hypothetical protein [Gammaproteobacteria bacterium]
MNILYIGSSGALSLSPFYKLLSSAYSVVAVAVYKPIQFQNKIIALENESLALAATKAEIPVIDLSQALPELIEQISDLSIDLIVMSCYSRRLPDAIINLAVKGCYNMHPSLLPRYRGPEPIFWQMKYADKTGVSWHKVIHELDAGDIVLQKEVFLDDGLNYSEISLVLAETGAELMLKLLSDIVLDRQTLTSQNADNASYYRYPESSDFVIDTRYSAQQIYNFMCATQAFSRPYLFHSGNYQFYLETALDYDNNRCLETVEIQGNRLYIPCNEGVLIAGYTDKIAC